MYSRLCICMFLAVLSVSSFGQQTQGSTGRFSVMGNRVQSFDPTHRINDRDYMGWMDFGRCSAEEYEYSS
ncbi:cholecystokinin-like [Hirundo rustica]|uniref:cholecystokinin-like n=1 Tax=Hirundo rustica TaxID=43150 RepID=UPI001A93F8A0|nr:cholecystokinin-like [Hirundo rustica]